MTNILFFFLKFLKSYSIHFLLKLRLKVYLLIFKNLIKRINMYKANVNYISKKANFDNFENDLLGKSKKFKNNIYYLIF